MGHAPESAPHLELEGLSELLQPTAAAGFHAGIVQVPCRGCYLGFRA